MNKPSAQICAAHQELITALLHAQSEPDEPRILHLYAEDGWTALVAALRDWRAGRSPTPDLLDEEDQAILAGLDYARAHPHWLATLADEARDEAAAAIAQMIFSATWGDHDALELLSSMREAAADLGQAGSTAHGLVAMVEGARDLTEITTACPQADVLLLRAVLARLTVLENDDSEVDEA